MSVCMSARWARMCGLPQVFYLYLCRVLANSKDFTFVQYVFCIRTPITPIHLIMMMLRTELEDRCGTFDVVKANAIQIACSCALILLVRRNTVAQRNGYKSLSRTQSRWGRLEQRWLQKKLNHNLLSGGESNPALPRSRR